MQSLTKSVEDYLEAILICEAKFKVVKSINLADFFSISRPAITKATKNLEENGLIVKNGNDLLLTERGRQIAEKVYQKHLTIKEFLIKLGVSESNAETDCCKIEHCISDETFNKIKEFCKK